MVGGEPGILHRFKLLESHLDERLRRLVAAAEAEALGARGISLVSRSTGVSRRAIRQGLQELREAERASSNPAGGWRAEEDNRERSLLTRRSGAARGADGAGRSGITVALDLQKRAAVGTGTTEPGSPGLAPVGQRDPP